MAERKQKQIRKVVWTRRIRKIVPQQTDSPDASDESPVNKSVLEPRAELVATAWEMSDKAIDQLYQILWNTHGLAEFGELLRQIMWWRKYGPGASDGLLNPTQMTSKSTCEVDESDTSK